MKVEIWSDIACPWCYIGRRRFETALKQFEHPEQVEVIWRSFQLDPSSPREYPGTLNEMLAKKKGIALRDAEAMNAQVAALAAKEGLGYHLEKARVGNSFDAHRVLHMAAQHEKQSEMKERVQKAYFTEGESFSDTETLVRLAGEVGLDADETRQVLASNQYAADVRADLNRAQEIGIRGVPFFLFDEKYAVSGAQPAELFLTALDRAWADSHPVIELVGAGSDAPVCEDESCGKVDR